MRAGTDQLYNVDPDLFKLSEKDCRMLTPAFESAARSFVKNFADMRALYWLPMVAARELAQQEIGFQIELEALLKDGNWELVVSKEQSDAKFKEDRKQIWDRYFREHTVDQIAERVAHYRETLQSDEGFARSVSAVSTSLTRMLWTTYECVSKDLWVALGNNFSYQIGIAAFKGMPSDGGGDISAKHISVKHLGRHNFDLRNVLGTVLSAKYDFSSVVGIRDAYSAVLGRKHRSVSIVDSEGLRKLEAFRHTIVHSGGMIDEHFSERVKGDYEMGSVLHVDSATLTSFITAVKESGLALLLSVDKWSSVLSIQNRQGAG